VTSSTNQKLAASFAPPATAPEPKQIQAPAGGPVAATVTPTLSARSLFYGGEPGRTDTSSMAAKEQEQAMKPLAESAPKANRPERPAEGLSQLGKTAGTVAQLRPLGLRYSLVVRGTNGRTRSGCGDCVEEYTAGISHRGGQSGRQSANLEDSWLLSAATAMAREKTAQTSQKIIAGQRQYISLPMESGPVTLTVRLSRVPPAPTTRHEGAMFDRLSLSQFQESITATNQPSSKNALPTSSTRSFHNRSGRC